jgi:putative restriction endonuclease
MRFYVGITDKRWFEYLRKHDPYEVNFWRPKSTSQFRVLEPGGVFLFKLHSPHDFIVGGGFFIRHDVLPLSLAWSAFSNGNGVSDINEFRKRIASIRRDTESDPVIGCTILMSPFFWEKEDWIPVPANWDRSIMRGKTYSTDDLIGRRLWADVQGRIHASLKYSEITEQIYEDRARYGNEFLTRARLGQGSFRVLVTDAYNRRCAITGERTLPVLEASHIKPYSDGGPNRTSNGLLLRSDLHTLFDRGYITVTPDYRIAVSKRIKEEYENGRDYYAFDSHEMQILPAQSYERPNQDFLSWHNDAVYQG